MLSEKVKNILEQNNGIISLEEAEKLNLSRETLQEAIKLGDLQEPKLNIYMLGDVWFDEMLITQKIYTQGIFSNESAVMLYNYSNWIPQKYYMTFPEGYSSEDFKKNLVKPFFATPKYYNLGITTAEDWDSNYVVTYDREKTVLDILSSNSVMFEVREQMIENYLDDPKKNISKLKEYAKLMSLEKELAEPKS